MRPEGPGMRKRQSLIASGHSGAVHWPSCGYPTDGGGCGFRSAVFSSLASAIGICCDQVRRSSTRVLLALLALSALLAVSNSQQDKGWLDSSLSFEQRAAALVAALTPDEKFAQLNSDAAPIERLGIPGFNYWSGCAHGVADFGQEGATIFPMPLALAATFDSQLMLNVATVIGDELRAKANEAYQKDGTLRWTNCFDPNINIYRDPRWGRGAETFGEDPLLTSSMVTAFVQGLQYGGAAGNATADASYAGSSRGFLKAGATCKHFAAYSLEEYEGVTRMGFNAVVDDRDLQDTYLPAFEACVKEGVASVMCSYNAVNGTPACASELLLNQTLRQEWQFAGFVVSDCDAIEAMYAQHAYAQGPSEAAAAALNAGTDLACLKYNPLKDALAQGLVTQAQIDTALQRLLVARLRQGHFDHNASVNPYAGIPPGIVGQQAHLDRAKEAAAKSIVLLKNMQQPGGGSGGGGNSSGATLPLAITSLRNITVVGPLANQTELLLGNYYGRPAGELLSPLAALQKRVDAHNSFWTGAVGPQASPLGLNYLQGSEVLGNGADVDKVASACNQSDVCLFFLGSSMITNHSEQGSGAGIYDMYAPTVEGETLDRKDLLLPGQQLSLVQAAAKRTNATIVVVLIHGGPLDVSWLQQSSRVGAILTAWFPGQGAEAIVDILFGDNSPCGRLPVTFYYNNYTDQSNFADMHMRPWPGRTHRFLQVPVLYPFGYGLSYAKFGYSLNLSAVQPQNNSGSSSGGGSPPLSSDWLEVRVNVSHRGGPEADEAVLLFLSRQQPSGYRVQPVLLQQERQAGQGLQPAGADAPAALSLQAACDDQSSTGQDAGAPAQDLVGFDKLNLKPGTSGTVSLRVTGSQLAAFSTNGSSDALPPCGRYWLRAGSVVAALDVAQPAAQ